MSGNQTGSEREKIVTHPCFNHVEQNIELSTQVFQGTMGLSPARGDEGLGIEKCGRTFPPPLVYQVVGI